MCFCSVFLLFLLCLFEQTSELFSNYKTTIRNVRASHKPLPEDAACEAVGYELLQHLVVLVEAHYSRQSSFHVKIGSNNSQKPVITAFYTLTLFSQKQHAIYNTMYDARIHNLVFLYVAQNYVQSTCAGYDKKCAIHVVFRQKNTAQSAKIVSILRENDNSSRSITNSNPDVPRISPSIEYLTKTSDSSATAIEDENVIAKFTSAERRLVSELTELTQDTSHLQRLQSSYKTDNLRT